MKAGPLFRWVLVAICAIQLATPLMAAPPNRAVRDPGAAPTIIRLDDCHDTTCG